MNYIIIATIFLLLAIVILKQEKENERFFWVKIILLFLSYILTFEIGVVRIPLGIIIAFFLTVKFSKSNISIKRLTLLFSLVGFIIVQYVTPPINFNDVLYSKDIYNHINKFEDIDYVSVFTNDAPIQEKIKKYYSDSPDIMFKTYVFMDRDIQIKNEEWLLYQSNHDLNIYWQSSATDSETIRISETSFNEYPTAWEEYIRFNNSGEEYFGVFEKESGKVYLKFVIKGKLKINHQPNSLF